MKRRLRGFLLRIFESEIRRINQEQFAHCQFRLSDQLAEAGLSLSASGIVDKNGVRVSFHDRLTKLEEKVLT
jgi:hypothetical protein